VFENRQLRKMFGPKGQKLTGGWEKYLHNEELRDLYSSSNNNNNKVNK
jgi:hypothetical protein